MERMIKLYVMIISVDYILSDTGLRIWRFTGKFNPDIFFFFLIDTIFIEFRNFEKDITLKVSWSIDRFVQIVEFRISFNGNPLSVSLFFSFFFLRAAFSFFSSVENCVLGLYTRCVQDNWTSFQVPRAVGYKTSTFLDRDGFDTKVLDFVRSTIAGIIFVHERRNLFSRTLLFLFLFFFLFLEIYFLPPFVHNIDNNNSYVINDVPYRVKRF